MEKAKVQAQVNANSSGRPWIVYQYPVNGYWYCEMLETQNFPYTVIYPTAQPNQSKAVEQT
jgi:hypothetical protein